MVSKRIVSFLVANAGIKQMHIPQGILKKGSWEGNHLNVDGLVFHNSFIWFMALYVIHSIELKQKNLEWTVETSNPCKVGPSQLEVGAHNSTYRDGITPVIHLFSAI